METFHMFESAGHRPHSSNVPTIQRKHFSPIKICLIDRNVRIKHINQLLYVFPSDFSVLITSQCIPWMTCICMSFTSDPEKPFHQLERIQAPRWKWQNKFLASSARCWGDATAYMPACSGHPANFVIGGWEAGNERRASIFPHRIVPSLSVRSLVISVSYCWSALLSLSPVYCLITSKQKEPVSYYRRDSIYS